LGFDWNKKLIFASSHLFEKVYGMGYEDVLEKMSNLTFKNNPFEGMKKLWP
jgi:hypothetical protein